MAVTVSPKYLSEAKEAFPNFTFDNEGHFNGSKEQEQEVQAWNKARKGKRSTNTRKQVTEGHDLYANSL